MKKVALFFFIIVLVFLLFYAGDIQASVTNFINSIRVTSGLVGYWSFDGSTISWSTNAVSDLSGNGKSGQLIRMSTSTSPVAGMVGQGLSFDGSAAYVDLGSTAGSIEPTSGVSISVWLKRQGALASFDGIVNSRHTSGAAGYAMLGTSANKIRLYIDTTGSSGWAFAETNNALPFNEWHLVTGTWDDTSDTVRIYVDGVLQTTTAAATQIVYSGSPNENAWIGQYQNSAQIFPGQMDDVRIYNRALSSGEIQYLYQLNAKELGNKTLVPNNNGLLAYWNFDDCDTCTRALDRSSNHFDGTMYGTCATAASNLHTNGKINNGATFDGSGDCVNMTSGPVATGNLSISLWFQSTDVTANKTLLLIVNSGSENVDYMHATVLSSRILACGNDADANCKSSPSSPTLLNNTWYHLVVTKTTGDISSVYLNGVDVTTAGFNNQGGGTAMARIGGSPFGSQDFSGLIDEVRVYNKILTAAEIQNLYRETRRLYITNDPYATAILRLAPITYWRLNEREGTTVNDDGLLKIKGTYVNTPTINLRGFLRASNQAVLFPSTGNSHVAFGYRPQLDLSAFSVTAWVKAANLSQYSAVVYHMNDAASQGWGAQLVSSTGLTELCTGSGAGANCVRNASAIVAGNTWYFLAFTVTGTTGKSYFNGSLETTKSDLIAPAYPSDVLTWIARRNGSELSFLNNDNLTIDEVAIFNYVLTATQITDLYNIGRAN